MIIDSHVHTFPYMGGASGFDSPAEHLRKIQRVMYGSINRPRRKRDNAEVTVQTLWNEVDKGPAGLCDVNFRVGKFGRLEWTAGGEDLWLQYFAPSLENNESSAEYIVAEMDYAGVDIGVLQNAAVYGLLNDFFADCIRRYPDRFIGLAQVREALAHTDAQLSELHRSVESLGLKGLFYHVVGFWDNDYKDNPDDAKYDVFWEEVRRLGLVLFWDPAGVPFPSAAAYTDQLHRMQRVLERHPGIPTVLVQALPLGYYARDGRYELPDVVFALAESPDFALELAYPISYGGIYEYPYVELQTPIQQLYDWFGPAKLVWGSDMPNVLRFCTYRQSYAYLRHCRFLGPSDLELILGGNLARLFGLVTSR